MAETAPTYLEVLKWSDDECRAYLEAQRWPTGPACPKCGNVGAWTITRRSKSKNRVSRFYRCKACKRQFTMTVGTIFEASKIPLSKWFAAIYLMCESKKGVSAHQVHRQLGIQYRSAWYMCHRIREAMREKGPRPILTGAIEADETYVGGKVRGAPMARSRRKARQGRAYPLQDKAIVFGLLQRGEPDVHTQGIENYWSILKRGLTGVFHHVDPAYLPQYLHEFEYRFNRRQITDAERFQALLRRVTGRLEWYRERPALADASEPEPAS